MYVEVKEVQTRVTTIILGLLRKHQRYTITRKVIEKEKEINVPLNHFWRPGDNILFMVKPVDLKPIQQPVWLGYLTFKDTISQVTSLIKFLQNHDFTSSLIGNNGGVLDLSSI